MTKNNNGTKWLIRITLGGIILAAIAGVGTAINDVQTHGERIRWLEACVEKLEESAEKVDGKLDAILLELRK